MLRDYNFDILKIDMSFVRKIETNTKTRSILRFLIDMAHEMGVSLIAEGAETQAQTAFLRKTAVIIFRDIIIQSRCRRQNSCSLLDNGTPLPEIDGWNQA